MPPKPYPPYAVDLPIRIRAGAGLAERYFTSDSPFLFKGDYPHIIKPGLNPRHDSRKLVAIRPEKFVRFLIQNPPTLIEEKILCEGLKAWAICPTKIIRTIHADSFETSSNDFVHSAMSILIVTELTSTLKAARIAQMQKKRPVWTARKLLGDAAFDYFDFEIFFLLGGLDEALSKASTGQLVRERENQRLPVRCVVALLHFLHVRLVECRRNPKLRPWGINSARREAARFLTAAGMKRGVSADTIRNHWEYLRRSAALLYAAAHTDNGHFLTWLLADVDPYEGEYVARFVPAWFKCANAVANQLLSPLHLLDNDWISLDVDGDQRLPPPLASGRMLKLLSMQLTEEGISGPNRSGEMIFGKDGSRHFIPL
jgi:hypothetical protein